MTRSDPSLALSDACLALSGLKSGYCVEIAKTKDELNDAFRLRHQVFCVEQGVIPAASGTVIETDHYDDQSHHITLRCRNSGDLVGTTRLITACESRPETPLPMRKLCDPALLEQFPMHGLGEVSRFALSPERRRYSSTSDSLLRLGLLRGILQVSLGLGLTHWCAMMERRLLRLLEATGVHFTPLGPMVNAYGLRQPATAAIGASLIHMRNCRPDYFEYVTLALADEREPLMLAA